MGEEVFAPIGIFTGVLDGAGHSIKNLKVNRTVSYSGLFSQTKGAVIKQLLLENVSVTSTQNYVGALVGHMEGGQIKGCAMEGAVTGYGYTGGLVGYVYGKATIEESGAFGSVRVTNTGSNYGGGLVGYGSSITLRNSYAACKITGNGKGLAYCSSSTVENSYYDGQRAGTGRDDTYNISKLTSGLIRRDFFQDWDFEESWAIEEGAGYPYPKGTTKEVFATESGVIEGGMGTEESPYLLGSRAGVDAIRYDLAGHYRLSKDIDLGEEVFAPIGIFTGVLDGAGHSIKNLKVNRTVSYSGLFSQTKEAVIKHLLIENVSVTSTQNYVGALVGQMNGGQVKGCAMEGTMVGAYYTGGLVGYAYNKAMIEESGAVGNVKSTNTGSSDYTGGLVGYGNSITIRNSYAACEITGKGKGLVYCSSSTVENSYYDGQRAGTGRDDTYNISKLTSGLIRRDFFQDWDFEESWAIEEGAGYPYPKGTTKEVFATESGVIEGGMGTEESPYLLGSRAGVDAIRYDLAGHYRLSKDIDLGEEVFAPIGIFTGVLDGAGHSIKNLKVNRTVSYSGLFSQTKEAVIKHLLIENVSVTSTQNYVGALVGQMNGGQVKGCAMEGTMVGAYYTGGLVGYAYNKAMIEESGAVGNVKSTNTGSSDYTGGLVGYGNSITIRNSYAACEITGKGKGLVYCGGATVENSYYDGQRAGTGREDTYNISKLTSGLIRRDFFQNWDFEESWAIEEGAGYPYPRGTTKEVFAASAGVIEGGMGTEESPYLLGSRASMEVVCYELAGHYRLSQDIDLGEEEFMPIGVFKGVLDGWMYTIKNLKQTRTADYTGLFSEINNATIRNLQIKAAVVSGGSYTGILAGKINASTVTNIFVKGTLSGGTNGSYCGGLVGDCIQGDVRNCKAEVSVSGKDKIGGLLGRTTNQTKVENCYALGSVTGTGTSYISGLIGYSGNTTIKSSYASCNTQGKGGLVSVYSSTTIENSYFDSTVSGYTGATEQAKTTEELMNQSTFLSWDVENIWKFDKDVLPELRVFIQESYRIESSCITSVSVQLKCPDYEDAEFYLLSCDERIYRLDKDSMIIENLLPGKEYTLRLQIQLTSGVVLLSDELKIKTRSFIGAGGLHSVQKGTDFIQMQWDTILEAAKYEIYCNGKKYETVENTLKLDNLQSNVPYHIYLRVIFNDGSIIVSEAIIEKIYQVVPETEYATDFIEKCDGENWFIDVLEYLLNQKGKSINWISSKKDLENIFVINLKSRGIAGKIPRAIGDLKELRYIYLEGNDISTDFPEELSQLNKLILFDLIS